MLISTWHRTIDDRPPKLVESVHVQNNKRPTRGKKGQRRQTVLWFEPAEGKREWCWPTSQMRKAKSPPWERPTLSQSSGTDSVSWSGRFLNCCLICTNAFSLFDFPNPSSFLRMHLRACVSSLTGLALWCWELWLTYIPKINQQYVHNL